MKNNKRQHPFHELEIAYDESGPADGWPVIRAYGFPYDIHAYDEVAPILLENRSAHFLKEENGVTPNPSIQTLLNIAVALDISLDELITRESFRHSLTSFLFPA